ncbi:MAG: HSP90 family protein [Cyanobacteria bacterium J06641_5]
MLRFLATIGQSSKRDDLLQSRNDYLGQFGIGLLSCFMVSEEIAVVTRSAKSPATQAIEWRGRSDGTYALRILERPAKVGTQIFLRAKSGCETYFEGDRLLQLARYYGGLLPDPIGVTANGTRQIANATPPPWRQEFDSATERRAALLAHGHQLFGMEFFDCIPLQAGMGGIEGVAYILPQAPSLASKPTHRVYLKNMLLSEQVTDLLPDWAFFVKCVINAEDLRPTASREAFYEDATLAAARGLLGQCLRDYLLELAQRDRPRLEELIALHYLAIKGLAAADDEFYELFIDWLPFETSLGRMTMAECRQQSQLYYAPTLDSFRQISQVAAAQSLCAINGGYTYDLALLERLPRIFPDLVVQCIDAATLVQNFTELTREQSEATAEFLRLADTVLQLHQCVAQIRKFAPPELPALYTANDGTNLQRSLQQSREISNPHFAAILDNLSDTLDGEPYAQLCFNLNNPLIAKLVALPEGHLQQLAIQMLYVQALLLGHHPLNAQEMRLLNTGLLGLIELGIDP